MTDRVDDTFTFVQPLADAEIRISEIHDHIHLTYTHRQARIPVTIRMTPEVAKRLFTRGTEITDLVLAGHPKGAA